MFILGTAQLRGTYGAVGRPDERTSVADAHALLRAAVNTGVAAIDTAPLYADAEALIGSLGLRIPIHTKLDPAREPADSVDRSLRLLRRDRLELVYFHKADIALRGPETRIQKLHALVGHKIERMGASVYEPDEFFAAVDDSRFDAVQLPLNVLDRRIRPEDLLHARERGVSVFARSVLLQGVLCASPDTFPAKLAPLRPFVASVQQLAAESGTSVLSLVVSWVRDLPGVDGLVLGARSPAEFAELVQAWRSPPLPSSVRDAIDALPVPAADAVDPRRWAG